MTASDTSRAGPRTARRVLVVDDEDSTRGAIAKFLTVKGYVADTAQDGVAALDRLRDESFDALLCDVRMPGMSGMEVITSALALRPDLAVLMLTAVNDAPTATESLARGAMGYLMKPIDLHELARLVDDALHRRNLEIQQRDVERQIREEVAVSTLQLRREQATLAEISISIVRALVNAQEAKDPYLRGHSQRVSAMSAAIGSTMGLPDDAIEDLRLAGQLHDVGKIGIPESLLQKTAPLTEEEFSVIREHVRIGMDILTPLKPLARVLPAIHDHHEHWDGSGYPRGLAGERISLGGRILAAGDAYDALTSRRAYRDPLSSAETMDVLLAGAGGHLDPAVGDAMRETMLGRASLHFIDEAR